MFFIRTTFPLREHVRHIAKRFIHREHKIKVNGFNINIVETGGGKNTLLLLPGTLGSSWTNFKPQIDRLPKLLPNYKIISWDPPGYGKSIPPERSFQLNMFENDAYIAMDLMRELKHEKFSLLGWSAGGITALIMAGRFPENIAKLISVGNGAYITEKEVKHFEERRDVSQWPTNIRKELEQQLFQTYSTISPKNTAEYTAKRLAIMWSAWVDLLRKFILERNGDFCKADVGCIRCPTFIIRGGKDPIISAEHAPYLLKHIKGSKYHLFPNGAHSVHITHADEFNKLVAKFLLESS